MKLADFGFAKKVIDKTFTLCGTPDYLAPEMILNKGHGKSVDWWTLGIFIYELMNGIGPFSDEEPMKTYQKILAHDLKFHKNFEKDAKSLIKHLLEQDVSKRFGCGKEGAEEVKNHRFFKGINWEKLFKSEYPSPYIPSLKDKHEASNFAEYPDSANESICVSKSEDPFLTW